MQNLPSGVPSETADSSAVRASNSRSAAMRSPDEAPPGAPCNEKPGGCRPTGPDLTGCRGPGPYMGVTHRGAAGTTHPQHSRPAGADSRQRRRPNSLSPVSPSRWCVTASHPPPGVAPGAERPAHPVRPLRAVVGLHRAVIDHGPALHRFDDEAGVTVAGEGIGLTGRRPQKRRREPTATVPFAPIRRHIEP